TEVLTFAFVLWLGVCGCKTQYISDLEVENLMVHEEPPPPAPIKFRPVRLSKTRDGNGYLNIHFDIVLENPTDTPKWFIFKKQVDKEFPELWTFTNDAPKRMPLRSYLYQAGTRGKGKCIVVSTIGGDTFQAVRLLPKAKLHLGDLKVMSKERFKYFSLLMADALLVNGTQPLEEWLPYNVTSTPNADIPEGARKLSLDFSIRGTRMRDDYPREEVKFIQADNVIHWELPISWKKK
ncbi:MAG: hypothetical protein D6820_06790, partial [Lentisphaerae bacterium]